MAESPARGTLHLVVGPSGAGKDALIRAARFARPDILVPTRAITRPADAGGEDHEAVTEAEFARRAGAGDFALWWRAHGLGYGVPREIDAALAAGRPVLVNVSRAVIDEARARYAPLRVLRIDAPRAVLAARIAARGRETAAEVAARLARKPDRPVEGPDVVPIDNGGALQDAVAAFVAALAQPPSG